eukprot:5794899-Pyramimonas_sp.AAC.1
MHLLSTSFVNLEDERQFTSGTALIDFRVEGGERIDPVLARVLARFEMARLEAYSVRRDSQDRPKTTQETLRTAPRWAKKAPRLPKRRPG